MRALRAYENMLFLDSWGLTFKKEATSETSEVLRGAEAVSYIEEEFLAVVDAISPSNGTGRITPNAVYGFLAKLYLNAGVAAGPSVPSILR